MEQVWGELQEFRHPSGDAEQALGCRGLALVWKLDLKVIGI